MTAVYHAAVAAIEAAKEEYDVGEDGSHQLVRVVVPVDAWMALMRVVLDARAGLCKS